MKPCCTDARRIYAVKFEDGSLEDPGCCAKCAAESLADYRALGAVCCLVEVEVDGGYGDDGMGARYAEI